MLDALGALDILCACLCIVLLDAIIKRTRQSAPHPPGPKGLPIVGNIIGMPTTQEWLTFSEWGHKYGPIIRVTVLGKPLIILNDVEDARALFDKRSKIYSDRPVFEMGGELVGWKYTLVLTPYGARFREYRRFIARLIGGQRPVQENVWPAQERETRRFLLQLLREPGRFSDHVRRTAGAVILKLSHGYDVKESQDPIVELVDTATEQFSLATAPGAFLVDFFPILRYVPKWMPGARFQRTAGNWRNTLQRMVDVPHDFVKRKMSEGLGPLNYTSKLLTTETLDKEGTKEFNIKWSAASLYSGGADTTVSATNSFFLAMSLFPEVQKRAQAELDSIVGTDRLPNFADRANLPYVDGLVKEVLRWNPVVPLCVPHNPTENDVYKGFYIAKGTTIIANIWHMLHDPAVYANPNAFNPARFVGERAEPDPREVCFGFGRRICPGLHLADASIFLSIAMVLSTFNISEAVDEDGNVIEPTVEYTSGTISHPKPLKCSIKPRSAKAEALIRAIE